MSVPGVQVDPFPCGACGTLVAYDTGCKHYRPDAPPKPRPPARAQLSAAARRSNAEMIAGLEPR